MWGGLRCQIWPLKTPRPKLPHHQDPQGCGRKACASPPRNGGKDCRVRQFEPSWAFSSGLPAPSGLRHDGQTDGLKERWCSSRGCDMWSLIRRSVWLVLPLISSGSVAVFGFCSPVHLSTVCVSPPPASWLALTHAVWLSQSGTCFPEPARRGLLYVPAWQIISSGHAVVLRKPTDAIPTTSCGAEE